MYQQPTIWVSNSTISDYLRCPRSYFLKNVYKNNNGKKIALVNPYLTLGQAVHEVLESLSELKSEDRFNISLIIQYEKTLEKYSGDFGGFKSDMEEKEFKKRGIA